MSSISRNRRSISKQRGAEMSSRLMPPKTGAIALTIRMISSASFVSRQSGKASTPANSLNRIAFPFHHRQRASGADVAEPEDGAAVGHHGHRVALDRQVPDRVRVVRDRPRDARDARRIRHREIVTRLQRDARADLELASEVAEERAVRHRLHLDAGQRTHRGRDPFDVHLVLGEDRDVAHLVRLLDAHQIDRPEQRALLADRRRDAAEGPGLIGQTDPQNRAERRRHVGHANEPTPATASASTAR
jgi:hypothetical protein